jgi:hypothetical protein
MWLGARLWRRVSFGIKLDGLVRVGHDDGMEDEGGVIGEAQRDKRLIIGQRLVVVGGVVGNGRSHLIPPGQGNFGGQGWQ